MTEFDTKVRRLAEKASSDPEVFASILDSALVAHVGAQLDGHVYVLPMACAPWQPDPLRPPGVLVHGSTGSRLMRGLAAGAQACVTVTLLDGVVLARSAYESSMHYRSAMLMGRFELLDGQAKAAAAEALTDHLLPHRRAQLRESSAKELAATMVLYLAAEQWSVKVADGWPDDSAEDIAAHPHLWAGVVPIESSWGEPRADEFVAGITAPNYLSQWPPPSRA